MIKKLNSNKERVKTLNNIVKLSNSDSDRELMNSLYGVIEELFLQ